MPVQTAENILPAPAWRGTPPNLVSKWLTFVSRHASEMRQSQRELVAAKIDIREGYVRDYRSDIAMFDRDIAKLTNELAKLRLIDKAEVDGQAIADELMAIPEVTGIRMNVVGLPCFHVRLHNVYGQWMVDAAIDLLKEDGTYLDFAVTIVADAHQTYYNNYRHDRSRYGLRTWRGDIRLTEDTVSVTDKLKLVLDKTKRSIDGGSNTDTAPALQWEGIVGDAGMFERLVAHLDNIQSKIREMELRKEQCEEERTRRINDIRSCQTELRQLRARLIELETSNTQPFAEAAARRQLKAITSLPGVVGFKFGPEDGIPVMLVRASVLHDGSRYDFGDYEVRFAEQPGRGWYASKQLDVQQVRAPITGANPYWEVNYFCFGARREVVFDCLTEGRFDDFAQLVVNSLCSVNQGHERYYIPDLTAIEGQKPKMTRRLRARRKPRTTNA